jgi:CzcA family heavy metal efflux pump
MVIGVSQLNDMPVDVFPEFAPPRVEVQTEAPGLSTTETEELLTIPLEEVLSATPGLDVMRSKTVPGLSSILLIFKPGTDLSRARQLVDERLAVAIPNLPTTATVPLILQPLSSTSRALKIGLTSDEINLIELSTIAFWTIRPRLMAVPGVANVAIWGERLEQIQVQVDPELLRAHKVSVDEVAEITADALEVGILDYSSSSTPGTGGWIDTPQQRLAVQHVLPINSPEELAQVAVRARKKHDGMPLVLSDLGVVKIDHPPLIGDAVINDGPGLMLIVEKFPWGNTLEVTRGVEEALDALRPGLAGIEIDSAIFRPATFVQLSIDNLTRAMLLGGVLVLLVLGLFLYEWRVALISATIIPLSLMSAIIVLNMRGATINVMVLAGLVIALGAVVDDAIVDVENIVRRLRQHRLEGSDQSTASIILEASVEVRNAIIFASLIEAAALIPVFFTEGLTGAFFQPLALSYVIAVLVSAVVALTFTPAMTLILLRNVPLEQRESPLTVWLRRGYDKVLQRIVQTPAPMYITTGVVALAGLGMLPFLGQELLPSFKERDFLMHWLLIPGAGRPEMVRITEQASRELRQIPGVRNFGAHIGRALAADEVVGIYFTENWISVDPAVDYDKTVAAIQATVDGYPGLVRDVQTYLKERIREVLTGSSEAIVVRIYGPELDVLRSQAAKVNQLLAGIEGVVDLHTELQVDVPQIEIEVDLAKAQHYGIKPGDVRRAQAALMASIEVGDIYIDQKAFDVAVWGKKDIRNDLTNLRELLIDRPGGGHVRLEEVADVRIMPSPNHIEHEGVTRRIDVLANVRGRDLGSVVGELERGLEQIDFPLEYHPELLGEFAERQAAQSRLFLLGIGAAILIFFLLQTSFDNWRLTILSFLTLPIALVGGLLAASVTGGGIISLGSLVGFLTVLGIVARNGIMLINHYQHLEEHEGETFGPELALRGARERLSPILMTGLTTGLALLPLVIAGNIPGHEIEHPMAIVILGGLVTSTLLNLFVVPPPILAFCKAPEFEANRTSGGVRRIYDSSTTSKRKHVRMSPIRQTSARQISSDCCKQARRRGLNRQLESGLPPRVGHG